MKHSITTTLIVVLCLCACNHKPLTHNKTEEVQWPEMEIADTDCLIVYYPQFNRIDLVCENMPSPNDSDVIFVAEAAFTADFCDTFSHSNIIGPHVCNGEYHKGCGHGYSTWFTYANGKAQFHTDLSKEARTKLLEKTAADGGMAFTQYMIVHNGKKTGAQPFKGNAVNEYRCLCEDKEGRICIADSKPTEFNKFRDALVSYGMKHAIYLDMGAGWNYSWYRDSKGKVNYIHTQRTKYTTNWVTFYK